MPLNQTNKLTWIVETLLKSGSLTFEELNQKWIDNTDMSEGKKMLKRTFHKWQWSILDTFGILIECQKNAPYKYYIANPEDLKNRGIESWLFSTVSVCNSLAECKSIKDRILLEDVPSGREYLEQIIEAMKKNRVLKMTYRSYWKDYPTRHEIMPLCVKLFRQRWYVLGRATEGKKDSIFCLDRIADMEMTKREFDYPKEFSTKKYFDGCFGIIAAEDVQPEKVLLKVAASQANYMRDLPMMEDQKEEERNKEYSIFSMRVKPTFDFVQELLWNREYLQVLQPAWLRKEIAETIKKMLGNYKKKR